MTKPVTKKSWIKGEYLCIKEVFDALITYVLLIATGKDVFLFSRKGCRSDFKRCRK